MITPETRQKLRLLKSIKGVTYDKLINAKFESDFNDLPDVIMDTTDKNDMVEKELNIREITSEADLDEGSSGGKENDWDETDNGGSGVDYHGEDDDDAFEEVKKEHFIGQEGD